MDILDALILGIVQGLAEFLPISSSGHLAIFREILGIDLGSGAANLKFDITLHVATVLSTLVVLWREVWPLCRSFFTFKMDDNFYYVCKILISCIPVGIVGICFKDTIEVIFGEGIGLVGCCLLATSVLLSFSYFCCTSREDKGLDPLIGGKPRDINFIDAFVIGCAQAIAVLPGLSRSGTTIATGILIGNKRAQVANFSFLMVIIPILGESLLHIYDLISPDKVDAVTDAANSAVSLGALATGFIAAFIVGSIACKWMLSIVRRGKLIWFAAYCLVVGSICIARYFGLF